MSETKTRHPIRSFTDLEAWQEGHKLVLSVYKVSHLFPREEMFGLTSQLRRCAISITSNIAEGFSRASYKEKAQFYSMAKGSISELQNQLLIARDVGYLDEKQFTVLAEQSVRVSKITSGLIKGARRLMETPHS